MNEACVDYLSPVLNLKSRKNSMERAIRSIRNNIGVDGFDTIAVRGISGVTFGTLLAHALEKNLCIIRKKDGSHSSNKIESGQNIQGRYIIVDDLVDTGRTVGKIIQTIKKEEKTLRRGAAIDAVREEEKDEHEYITKTRENAKAIINTPESSLVGMYLYQDDRFTKASKMAFIIGRKAARMAGIKEE